jgi:hypothetical protein
MVSPSLRSIAALQIPGLQLGDVAEPIVFEPDGTADRDAIIRLADRSNRYIEITLHGITGAVTVSEVIFSEELAATSSGTASEQQPRGWTSPSRSREVKSGIPGE